MYIPARHTKRDNCIMNAPRDRRRGGRGTACMPCAPVRPSTTATISSGHGLPPPLVAPSGVQRHSEAQMTHDEFAARYDLRAKLRANGVESWDAIRMATQQPVMVHRFVTHARARLLDMVEHLEPAEQARIIER